MKRKFLDYLIGNSAVLFIGFISVPIITRLISPEELGRQTYAVTLVSILACVIYFGFDQVYVRFYHVESRDQPTSFLRACVQLPVTVAVCLSAGIVLLYRVVSPFIVGESSLIFTVSFSFYIVLFVIDRFSMMSVRMQQKSKKYVSILALNKASYLILVFCAYQVFGNSYLTLSVSLTLSYLIAVLTAVFTERKIWFPRSVSTGSSQTSKKTMWQYGAPYIISDSLLLLLQSVDKIMLKSLTSYQQVGIYSGATNIIAPITAAQIAFTTFWIPIAYEHYHRAPDDRSFYSKASQYVTPVMLVLAVALIFSRSLVTVLLGAEYEGAVYAFPLLALKPIMYTISETTALGINFKMKTKYHSFVAFTCILLNCLLDLFLIPKFGAKGAAISTGISYLLFYFIRTLISKKLYSVNYHIAKHVLLSVFLLLYALYATFVPFSLLDLALAACLAAMISFAYRTSLRDLIRSALPNSAAAKG